MHRYQSSQQYVRLIMTFTAGLWMLVATAFAQQSTGGNIFGKVTDKSGGALPGVTVTGTSQTAPLTFTKNQTAAQTFCYWWMQAARGQWVSPNGGQRTCQ